MHDVELLLILVAASVLGPILAARARLPAAVVLMLTGLALGPGGFGLLTPTPTIAFLGELGFLVLMFIAGMEIDFEALRAAGLRALLRPMLILLSSAALATLAGLWLGLSVIHVMVLSATSVGLPLALLHETGYLRAPLGRQLMLLVSLGEFITVLVITLFDLVTRVGLSTELELDLGKLVGLFVISVLALRWGRAVVWWNPHRFERVVASHDVAELGVRVGMLLMLGFVALAALLGVEQILGAFIAGALLAWVLRGKEALEQKVAALGNGLFIPLFFLLVGVRFQPRNLSLPSLRDAALLVGVIGVIKLVPMLLLADRKLGLGERLAAACIFASPLTLVLAIGAVGERVGVLDADAAATIVLVSLGLSLVYPTLFRLVVTWRALGVPPPP